MSDNVPAVYAAIVGVSGELATTGISKSRKNKDQGYNFRGIDDVYNALAPVLARHGLCILTRVLSRAQTERATKSGGTMYSVVVEAEFDVVAASDASRHVVRTFGEAMDTADKATNKAMSAAYKYMAMQVFAIPTEGDNDADAATPEDTVQADRRRETPSQAEARRAEHDPSWSAAQAGFCARLREPDVGATYDQVCAVCDARRWPRPSALPPDRRDKLVAFLVSEDGQAALSDAANHPTNK